MRSKKSTDEVASGPAGPSSGRASQAQIAATAVHSAACRASVTTLVTATDVHADRRDAPATNPTPAR